MTIQKVAFQILKEEGHPLDSGEIAELALKRGMVSSNARDPVFSLKTTLLKNIRENKYNIPKLCFIGKERGRRLIGLPEWGQKDKTVTSPVYVPVHPLMIEINGETVKMIRLAQVGGLGNSENETVSRLIHAGFKALSGEIESELSKRLDDFKKM